MNGPEDDSYANRLRAAIERDGWSQARLIRELAARTGNAAESERSAVRGYLAGAQPRPERAALIAEITAVPELATVERRSATARLEGRLEELAANDAELLALLLELRDSVALLTAAGRTAPKRIPKKAAR